jgi:hypothetical protein
MADPHNDRGAGSLVDASQLCEPMRPEPGVHSDFQPEPCGNPEEQKPEQEAGVANDRPAFPG